MVDTTLQRFNHVAPYASAHPLFCLRSYASSWLARSPRPGVRSAIHALGLGGLSRKAWCAALGLAVALGLCAACAALLGGHAVASQRLEGAQGQGGLQHVRASAPHTHQCMPGLAAQGSWTWARRCLLQPW